jgi:hypothetical protein
MFFVPTNSGMSFYRDFRYVFLPKSAEIAIFTGFVHIEDAFGLYGAGGQLRLIGRKIQYACIHASVKLAFQKR